jgi:hypothetical protein
MDPLMYVVLKLGYGLDDQGLRVRFPEGEEILFSTTLRPALGTNKPSTHWIPEVGGTVFPSTAEFKNAWSYTSTPHMSS